MNLRWNPDLFRFEAEFSSDFQGDLAAVKAAGFKTDGAPAWTWYTYKAGPLTELRNLRPGLLTISPDGRANYTRLREVEERNAKVKAELAQHTKQLKKTLRIQEQEGNAVCVPEKGYVEASDFPPMPIRANSYTPPPPPDTKCCICQSPVYFYEKQDPPTCLYCEKLVLDNSVEVC